MVLGVDSNDILTETKAEHSCENIYYSFLLARDRDHGIINSDLATDLVQINLGKKYLEEVDF